jgi:lysyl-tRNA synthetase class 1
VISTGITPSGIFHIGHIREILTGEMLTRAAVDAGMDVEMIFIIDTADPLRKVYDFLSAEYENYIGHPIGTIPAPDASGKPSGNGNYGEYFLSPFVAALKQIGVEPRLVDNYQSYIEGKFNPAIRTFIDKREQARDIIERVSGRELDDEWFPFNPVGSDGSMDGVVVTGHDWPVIHWLDSLGVEGSCDLSQTGVFHGKLPWRLDWPAKWSWLKVTCEPFGKDHGAAGGSYDTGRELSALLEYEAPLPLTYEWIQLKGMGAMSSSTGVTIGPLDALRLVPPEILRFLIARNKTNRHIDFDTGDALIELADEYERLLGRIAQEGDEMAGDLNRRQQVAWEVDRAQIRLSQVKHGAHPDLSATAVTFRHLAMLAQIRERDEDIWASLHSSGHLTSPEASATLSKRLACIRVWVGSEHFPDGFRLRLQSQPSAAALENINSQARLYLSDLEPALAQCEWDIDSINSAICDVAAEHEIGLRQAFVFLYWIFLDQHYGPKMASLLVELPRNDVVSLLKTVVDA